MSELVTGEAVALELRPARLPSRALAVLLDLAVVMAVYVAVTVALVVATASLDEAAQVALSIATFLLVLVGGPIAVETLSHGRSLGKMACGLRVVRDDGGPIRFRHALVRGAIGVVEILMTFGVVACIASLVSARGRRLGDVFAGTLVVRERIPAGQAGFLPPPPPWLAGRFSALDLSAVPDGLWLAVRQYLTRMHQLDPQVGWGMAQRLAADVSARTGTPVPPEIPPAMYLAAVLQERQAREARRAFGGTQAVGGAVAESGGTAVGAAPMTGPSVRHGFSVPQTQSMPSLPYPVEARPEWPVSGAGARSGPPAPVAPPAPAAPVPSEPAAPPAVPRDAARTEPPATGFVPPA
ncbi:RDD family protein [Streptomyces sp. Li-HN-5-11]|uniref:RDD family protein n=1 Tax=Streptomyces sp. Li-HN-5-11 TaxID=3075432 RepID=UPI0028B088C6|nr:RDD family protein [Streptomyces sp. Li-HN-5-11]WNM35516.1 RDD family protein [Streptomyces sp. Li-HN-5-11]